MLLDSLPIYQLKKHTHMRASLRKNKRQITAKKKKEKEKTSKTNDNRGKNKK